MAGIWQDLRYAARALIKHRGFAIAAALTLALGIGASSAIFSVVNGVLLKPLPFQDPQQLVSLTHHGTRLDLPVMNHGPATYFVARDNQRALEGIGGWDGTEVSITGRGEPERLEGLAVSAATLPLLRLQPALGRFFRDEDEVPGAPLRVVLSHGYWQRRYGGAATAIGESFQVNGVQAEVIGVLPPTFRFLERRPAVLVPLRPDRAATGIQFGFQALARMKPGVTLEQANADMGRWLALLPPVFKQLGMSPRIRPLAEEIIGDIRDVLWILFAAVGVVLLIACGNVANLFMIRAEARHQELALRSALGASRGRIARALLAESTLLGLAGGLLGLGLATGATRLIRELAPASLPRVEDIGIDWTVLLFTVGITLASGVVFGLAAVARFGAPGAMALKEGGRSVSDGPARHRTRNVLVVAQVAMALMLLIVSGLMVRTFVAMRDVHPGFTRPAEVLTFRVAIPEATIADPKVAALTHQQLTERLAQVPGVVSVGSSTHITMDGEDNGNPVLAEDVPIERPPLRRFKSVAPGFFETMGNPVVAGRAITWEDIHEERPVVMISAALAREYWKNPASAVGKRLRTGPPDPWREIVGVVGDERDDGLNHPATEIVYWPLMSESYRWRTMAYAVRSSRVGAPEFLREIQHAVWSVNANLPIATVETLDEIQARSMAQTSFTMVMLAIAASVALALGIVGIYGVIAYVATQRTRETGIRLALGAQVGDVRRMFLRHGLGLTATGIVLGVVVAVALTRLMSSLLFGVAAVDLATYVGMSAVLGSVALLATYLPARRASRVDPVIALRGDAG
ncbi:MAG: ABC transporter permease [Gemmatimonadaceae bacterium]